MKWKDRNTKFFHVATIQRRQGNRISILQLHDNTWNGKLPRLKAETVEFLVKLYATMGSCNYQPIVEQYPCVIGDDINEALMAKISLEEVKVAIF